MNAHHKGAMATIAAAALLDAGLGIAFAFSSHVSPGDGLYWATTTATTVGYGDLVPHGWLPHLIAIGVMLTVIPLFAATFSLFTSGLADVAGAEDRIKRHVNGALRHHLLKGAAVADPPK